MIELIIKMKFYFIFVCLCTRFCYIVLPIIRDGERSVGVQLIVCNNNMSCQYLQLAFYI